jgi:hypothetical protein
VRETEIERKLYNEEFRDLYSSPYIPKILRIIKLVGHLARIGATLNYQKILARNPEDKKQFGTN